jgi:1,4-dihydroxy-2-naphthoyl-CoA synthase
MRRDMREAVGGVAGSNVRALLVRGEGPDFCLGGDVHEWASMPAAELRPKIEVFAQALDQLGRLDIPTLAAVQGCCVGGGFELAMTCDMIVAGWSARFSCSEAAVGRRKPGLGSPASPREHIRRIRTFFVQLVRESSANQESMVWATAGVATLPNERCSNRVAAPTGRKLRI